jgi:hypothetical protein
VLTLSPIPTCNARDCRATVHVGLADSGPKGAARFLRPCRQEGPSSSSFEQGGLCGYLLAWLASLSAAVVLVCLAVLPPHGVTLQRWLILASGVGCTLLVLLAPLLSTGTRSSEP